MKKKTDIPTEDSLMGDAHTLIEASKSWPVVAGKGHPLVTTSMQKYGISSNKNKPTTTATTQVWNCVVSTLQSDELSFSRVWARLGKNKAWNQQFYVPGITRVARVKYISESQSIWTILFIYPPPLSPRVYTIYQASWLLEYSHRRQGIVITLPIDLSSKSDKDLAEVEEKGVRGRFLSVEHIHEIDGDKVEWRRLVCVDPGGMIPKCWTKRNVLSRMVEVFLASIPLL
ncbi:hypothetical protein M413DRAFT_68133 [Hebeloma cylindrosporum]|uniref:DUF3074 domain-containing protein n=1 Tax=Hebeloma cylindrosporum TaxID=76867 RepID=A0A0C2YT07_HEBCY|nr:hypothetical protein M413DRAFT_68133 [Hebeloma cylindrosporum h7]